MPTVALHPVAVTSRNELNAHLARFGLPQVPAVALEPLRAKVGRNNLLRALSIMNSPEADHEPARKFLLGAITTAFKECGVPMPAVTVPNAADEIPDVPESAPAPAEARAAQPHRPTGVPSPSQSRPAPAHDTASAAPLAHREAPPRAPQADTPEGQPPGRPHRLQARAYGKRAALCVEEDETRGNEPTISIELAPARGPRDYDWGKKVRFQLTSDELPQLLAVLCGYANGIRFSNHGADNKKWLQVEYQTGGYYIKGGDGESMLMLPVSAAGDQTGLYALTLRQARKAAFGIDSPALLQYIRNSIAPKIQSLPTREAAAAGGQR